MTHVPIFDGHFQGFLVACAILAVAGFTPPAVGQRTIEIPPDKDAGRDRLGLIALTPDNRRVIARTATEVVVYALDADRIEARRSCGPSFILPSKLVGQGKWLVGSHWLGQPGDIDATKSVRIQICPLEAVVAGTHGEAVREVDLSAALTPDALQREEVLRVKILDLDANRFAVQLAMRTVSRAPGEVEPRGRRTPKQVEYRSVVAIVSIEEARASVLATRSGSDILLGREGDRLTSLDIVRAKGGLRPNTQQFSARRICYALDGSSPVDEGRCHSFSGLNLHFIYSPTGDFVFLTRPYFTPPLLACVTSGRFWMLPGLSPMLDEYSGSFSRDGSLLALMGTRRAERRQSTIAQPFQWIAVYNVRQSRAVKTIPLDANYHRDLPVFSEDKRWVVVRILEPGPVHNSAGGALVGIPLGFQLWKLPEASESNVSSTAQ